MTQRENNISKHTKDQILFMSYLCIESEKYGFLALNVTFGAQTESSNHSHI